MKIRNTSNRIEPDTIHLGDCLRLMPFIQPQSVDFIFCDLPYGQTAPKWDKHINIEQLWENYNRILKPDGVIALFAAQPFTALLITSNQKRFKYCWYWIKNQGTNFFHAKRMPIRKVEEICIFGGKKYNPQITDGHVPTCSAKGTSTGQAYHGTNTRDVEGGKTTRYPNNLLFFDCVDNYSRLHSAQKPADLLEYIIKTYTDENDVVLDNCAGSGSTGVACLNTNRRYILMESVEENFQIARARLEK